MLVKSSLHIIIIMIIIVLTEILFLSTKPAQRFEKNSAGGQNM